MRCETYSWGATCYFGTVACTGGVYSAEVTATTPSLVLIEPGIAGVVGYGRYQNNTWYRSSDASGGWIRIGVIPQHLRRIERPQQYVQYPRPSTLAVVHAPQVRDHQEQGHR